MLAGRVKLKTFVAVTSVFAAGLLGAGYYYHSTRPSAPSERHGRGVVQPESRSPAGHFGEPAADAVGPEAPADTTWHPYLLSQLGRDLGTHRAQDVRPNERWKVNLYQDDGFATINRAKLDLDRDERWDEKWTFHPEGRITRQVSPSDDGEYTEHYEWVGTAWIMVGAVVDEVVAEEPLRPDDDYPLLAAHRWVLEQGGRDLGVRRIQEAVRGRSYKVNLYQDEGQTVLNRAKIDHDRDHRWDERWTFHPDGRITIEVSPADDEQYTERYAWNAGGWRRD